MRSSEGNDRHMQETVSADIARIHMRLNNIELPLCSDTPESPVETYPQRTERESALRNQGDFAGRYDDCVYDATAPADTYEFGHQRAHDQDTDSDGAAGDNDVLETPTPAQAATRSAALPGTPYIWNSAQAARTIDMSTTSAGAATANNNNDLPPHLIKTMQKLTVRLSGLECAKAILDETGNTVAYSKLRAEKHKWIRRRHSLLQAFPALASACVNIRVAE